jgi:CheY-like chemotaxis protein
MLEATDGEEALRIVHQQLTGAGVHLLLTDVVLPTFDGCELADHLRREYSTLKLLYCSGYAEDVVREHGVSVEEDNIIQKPISPALLAQKVREVLDRE